MSPYYREPLLCDYSLQQGSALCRRKIAKNQCIHFIEILSHVPSDIEKAILSFCCFTVCEKKKAESCNANNPVNMSNSTAW